MVVRVVAVVVATWRAFNGPGGDVVKGAAVWAVVGTVVMEAFAVR